MSVRLGAFGTEAGRKSIDSRSCGCEGLKVKLGGDGEKGFLAEEQVGLDALFSVGRSFLAFYRDRECFASAFAVAGSNYRCMYLYESIVLRYLSQPSQ